MKRLTYFLLCLFILAIAIGCSRESNTESWESADYALVESVSVESSKSRAGREHSGDISPITDRKLIKTGSIDLEAESIQSATDHIITVVNQYKGYVSSENSYVSGDYRYNTLTIRIPSEYFDVVLKEVTQGTGDLTGKNIHVTDVTEEFLDTQARISTKKELEARYKELLKEATTVAEMLEIEREIGILREDIEAIEGRLQYLKNQTSLATLTIHLSEWREVEKKSWVSSFIYNLSRGWRGFTNVILELAHFWPYLLIVSIIVVILQRRNKKRRQKTNIIDTTPEEQIEHTVE